ncbi:MAG: SRPBCC domain-containing protein [Alphaproteobacteria bacterium]|nr:SRPBCC domain-containing protein [Alphaproteobacteria bacterium]
MAEASEIRREVFIKAKPKTVFAFLVDAAKMRQWMGVTHELDARPGGVYRVDMANGNIAAGKYVEVVADRRVVFTWGWEGGENLPPGASTVAIDLAAEGAGTRVTLVHTGLAKPAIKPHSEGWEHYLERLAVAGAGGDPGTDPWIKKPMPEKKPAAKRVSAGVKIPH